MSEPKDYEYILPADYVMKDKHRKKLDVLVGNSKLTNPQAQKLLDLHVELVEEYAGEMEKYVKELIARAFLLGIAISAVVVSLLFYIF